MILFPRIKLILIPYWILSKSYFSLVALPWPSLQFFAAFSGDFLEKSPFTLFSFTLRYTIKHLNDFLKRTIVLFLRQVQQIPFDSPHFERAVIECFEGICKPPCCNDSITALGYRGHEFESQLRHTFLSLPSNYSTHDFVISQIQPRLSEV